MLRVAIIVGSLALLALGIYLAIRQATQCPRCERIDHHDGG